MRIIRMTFGLWFILKLGQLALGAAEGDNTLTNAADVHRLSRQVAIRGLAVKLQGVVTYSDPVWRVLFVRDASAGVYVALAGGPFPTNTELVEISGRTLDGSFLPVIAAAS